MASQNEIAKRAGVSQSVVSRVLNGRAKEFGITNDTAQRVTALADSLGYRPNPAASMLLGGASKLVGVVVRSFDDPYLAAILQELNRGALAAGRTLLVAGLEGDARQRADEIRLLQHYRPDALIVVGSTDFSQWTDDLFVPGKPVVQIGLPVADPRVVSCGLDEAAAAREIVRHLHESGHHRCGLIGDATPASHARARHIRAAWAGLKQPNTPALDLLSPLEGAEAGAQGAAFLRKQNLAAEPIAIIATGDLIALGLMRKLGEQGLTIPHDVAVASYDDLPVAALFRPSLTTLRQPTRELAAAAMAVVTGDAPPDPVLLRGELILRESSARL